VKTRKTSNEVSGLKANNGTRSLPNMMQVK